jgi:hypothetical protein
MLLVRQQRLLYLSSLTTVSSNLLRRASRERFRVEHVVEFGPDGLEEFGLADAFDEVVLLESCVVSSW